MNDAVMRSQSYAVTIEHLMSKIFSCDRFGVGGIVNSDYIRKQPIVAMIHTVLFIYATANENKRQEIESFINELSYYNEWSIDILLSFDSNEKVINGSAYGINSDNGEQELEMIIEKFRTVIK